MKTHKLLTKPLHIKQLTTFVLIEEAAIINKDLIE